MIIIINIINNVNISIIINYKNYNYNNNNNNNNYNKNVNNHIMTTMLLWFSAKFSSVGACGTWVHKILDVISIFFVVIIV